MLNFKEIHIGQLIQTKIAEENITMERAAQFMKCTESDIHQFFLQKELSTDIVLKWSKLLEYDFFRLYSQHLVLYAPPKKNGLSEPDVKKKSNLPQFRKKIYTKEVILFILKLIISGEKTKQQVMDDYRIPKTTLYTWIRKYSVYVS
ncbi:transposase [Chryseobacterium tructae]|uniref:Transposase n=2 Tax=Chryseobacterium tructae TaxID=1037380 RepID=A0ABV7XZN4_9FLAO